VDEHKKLTEERQSLQIQAERLIAENGNLNRSIELLWTDLKKEQFESGLLKIQAQSKEKSLKQMEQDIYSLQQKLQELEGRIKKSNEEIDDIKKSEVYTTALQLYRRRFLWKLMKKLI